MTKVDRRTYACAARRASDARRAASAALARARGASTSRARFASAARRSRGGRARQKKNDERTRVRRRRRGGRNGQIRRLVLRADAGRDDVCDAASSEPPQHVDPERRGRRGRRSGAGGGGGAAVRSARGHGHGLGRGVQLRRASTSGCRARASFPRSRHVVTFVVVRARYSCPPRGGRRSRKPSKLSKNFERVDCWVIAGVVLCRAPPVGRTARRGDAGAPRARLRRARRRLGAASSAGGAARNLWTGDGRPRSARGASMSSPCSRARPRGAVGGIGVFVIGAAATLGVASGAASLLHARASARLARPRPARPAERADPSHRNAPSKTGAFPD